MDDESMIELNCQEIVRWQELYRIFQYLLPFFSDKLPSWTSKAARRRSGRKYIETIISISISNKSEKNSLSRILQPILLVPKSLLSIPIGLCELRYQTFQKLIWVVRSDSIAEFPSIDPRFWFNLADGSEYLPYSSTVIQCALSPICPKSVLRTAKECKISLVKSTFYPSNSVLDADIAEYFKSPKFLSLGDLFCIPSKTVVDVSDEKQSARNSNHRISYWFKVTDLSLASEENRPPAYDDALDQAWNEAEIDSQTSGNRLSGWISSKCTRLYQVSSIHANHPSVSFANNDSGMAMLNHPKNDHLFNLCGQINSFTTRSAQLMKMIGSSWRQRQPLAVLLHGPSGCGKSYLTQVVGIRMFMEVVELDCITLWSEVIGNSETRIRNAFQNAAEAAPCILLLKNVEVLGRDVNSSNDGSGSSDVEPRIVATLDECLTDLLLTSADGSNNIHSHRSSFDDRQNNNVIVVATTKKLTSVAPEVKSLFLCLLEFKPLTEQERLTLLNSLIEAEFNCITQVPEDKSSLRDIAQRSSGLVLADFISLIKLARINLVSKNPHFSSSSYLSSPSGQKTAQIMEAIDSVLNYKQRSYGHSIGAPKIPNVSFDDVGGLEDAKRAILDTVELARRAFFTSDSSSSPEHGHQGISFTQTGILLHGPPGCGKTLLAKAAASECCLTFLSVKGPELLNMYVGQSEENVREVFSQARSAAPCIVFFDELDALAPNRGRTGDSGGVMDRVVSSLLSELDGIGQKAGEVIVIGATNRPDLVDPSLLRPGRFDKLVYVGLNDDRPSQLKVLEAVTRKLAIDWTELSMEDLVKYFPTDISGADIYAIVSEAANEAISRVIHRIEAAAAGGEIEAASVEITEDQAKVSLTANDLKKILEKVE